MNKKEMIDVKTSILLVITIIISLLLLTLPATASDYTLGVFGNANEDDTINMQDMTYTEMIILEYRDETELADAKYDGGINILDVTQIELIILGREKELTLIDSLDKIVTVKKPVEGIVALSDDSAEAIRAIGAKDKIVGVEDSIKTRQLFYPELSKLPSVGNCFNPDLEVILELKPDLIISLKQWPSPDKLDDKLPFTVARFDCGEPKLGRVPQRS